MGKKLLNILLCFALVISSGLPWLMNVSTVEAGCGNPSFPNCTQDLTRII